jgi:hypothetical protein
MALVDNVYEDARNIAKTIMGHMREYTLHDETHIENVIDLMARLMPDEVRTGLQPLEIAGLILSAALHDVGMAISEEEARRLMDASSRASDSTETRAYNAFRGGFPRLLRRQGRLTRDDRTHEILEIEAFILSEYLRRNHGSRSRHLIFERFEQKLIYKDFNFTSRLAEVCRSHTQEPEALHAIPCYEIVASPGEYCNWRFIAVMLRLADILDFDAKRTPSVLFEQLGVRSPVSVREWKKHKAITGWDIGPARVRFGAQCPDPVIEKTIREFVGLIDRELTVSKAVIEEMHEPTIPGLSDRYSLELPTAVDTKDIGAISGPSGPVYDFIDLSFHLDEDAIEALLMGVQLYGERILFLRELLQNAIDACRYRQSMHKAQPELGAYDPMIWVRLKRAHGMDTIEVEDNGMGMDHSVLRDHFARVGSSFYDSEKFLEERVRLGLDFRPAAKFGIGVLSTFMAGEKIVLQTRRFGENGRPIAAEISAGGTLYWFSRGTRKTAGTCIGLELTTPTDTLFRTSTAKGSTSRNVSTTSFGAIESEIQVTGISPHAEISMRRSLVDVGPPPVEGEGPPDVVSGLPEVVERLAPHVEFPIIVDDGSQTTLSSTWRLPPIARKDEVVTAACKVVDVDLSELSTIGLAGRARFYILGRGREIEEHKSISLSTGVTLVLRHGYGWIRGEDMAPVGVSSKGSWTQYGLSVPHSIVIGDDPNRMLFGESAPELDLPFATHFDIDLSGDLALPLTIDRQGVIPGVEAQEVANRLSGLLAFALLRSLGREFVEHNASYFHNLTTPTSPFGIALEVYLSETSV